MIVSAAICPHPPLLVHRPGDTEDRAMTVLRAAVLDAVRTMLAQGPDRVVVVGASDEITLPVDESHGGSLRAYGLQVYAGGQRQSLSLAHTVGAWLLDQAGWTGSRAYVASATHFEGRIALLAMADGSAKVSELSPAGPDPRSVGFQQGISDALRDGDAAALANIEPELSRALWSTAVPGLSALGEMVEADTTKGTELTAQLRYDSAPFGVSYWAADWVIG